MGRTRPNQKLEDGMSDQFNMRNDDVFYDLMRMWQVDPTALVEGVSFIPEPGAIIEMKPNAPANAIKQLDSKPVAASAYREYTEWESVIQGTSGVTDYATGASEPGMNPTLGGVEKLQAAANNRFQLKLNLFENLGLTAIGTQYIQRNIRYYDSKTPVKTRQGKMIIKPESIRRLQGPIRFRVTAGSTEAQNYDKDWARWKAVADMAGDPSNPIFANLRPESYDAIAKGILDALRVPNAEELVVRAQTQPGSVDPTTGQPRTPVANLNPDGSIMAQEQLEALAGGAGGQQNVEQNTRSLYQQITQRRKHSDSDIAKLIEDGKAVKAFRKTRTTKLLEDWIENQRKGQQEYLQMEIGSLNGLNILKFWEVSSSTCT